MIYNEANSIISLELKNVLFFIRKTVLHLGTVSRGVDLEESCCRRLSPQRRRIYSEVKKKGRQCCLGDRID